MSIITVHVYVFYYTISYNNYNVLYIMQYYYKAFINLRDIQLIPDCGVF